MNKTMSKLSKKRDWYESCGEEQITQMDLHLLDAVDPVSYSLVAKVIMKRLETGDQKRQTNLVRQAVWILKRLEAGDQKRQTNLVRQTVRQWRLTYEEERSDLGLLEQQRLVRQKQRYDDLDTMNGNSNSLSVLHALQSRWKADQVWEMKTDVEQEEWCQNNTPIPRVGEQGFVPLSLRNKFAKRKREEKHANNKNKHNGKQICQNLTGQTSLSDSTCMKPRHYLHSIMPVKYHAFISQVQKEIQERKK